MYMFESASPYASGPIMQDPYSTMMQQQQHHQQQDPTRSFKSYQRPSTTGSSSSFYHGMHYAAPSFTTTDAFPQIPMTSSVAISNPPPEYSPLGISSMHGGNNGMHHQAQTSPRPTHTQSHLPQPLTSQASSPSSNMGMIDLSMPPMPSGDLQIKTESKSPVQELEPVSSPSTGGELSPSPHNISGNSNHSNGDSKPRESEEDSVKMPPKKRPLSMPDEQRDPSYWDKRKKNNESAKRSREARRMKEEQIALRVVFLEQENLQLRTEVSLLKSEIEKLRCMLYNS